MTSSGTDPICPHCGRPVIGVFVQGKVGRYHPACVEPPVRPSGIGPSGVIWSTGNVPQHQEKHNR
jgi:hypothetical protein